MSQQRDRDLATIRDTYGRYAKEGRSRLWDPSNRGYARMIRDRDAALVAILRAALPVGGAGRVLDLGCGDGALAGVARDAGLEFGAWTGADLDPASVASAQERWPWATFITASADKLPFEDRSFDVVVASTLFSSLPSWEMEAATANEITRVLAPAGSLVWYDLRYRNPANPDVHAMSLRRLERLFPGWRREVRSLTLLPPMARRLGPATPALYPVLSTVPLLRSHLVGRFFPPY